MAIRTFFRLLVYLNKISLFLSWALGDPRNLTITGIFVWCEIPAGSRTPICPKQQSRPVPAALGVFTRKKCASADKQAGCSIPIRTAEGLILKSSPAPDHHGAAIRSDRDLRPLNRGIPVDHARNAVSTRYAPYGRAFPDAC